jgi:predicted metal-binding membrane protein
MLDHPHAGGADMIGKGVFVAGLVTAVVAAVGVGATLGMYCVGCCREG